MYNPSTFLETSDTQGLRGRMFFKINKNAMLTKIMY